MEKCKLCYETEHDVVKEITIVVKRENPKAYGYPEIAYWENKFRVVICPLCGRIINDKSEE